MSDMFPRGFKSWCENVAVQVRRDLKLKAHEPLDPFRLSQHLGIQFVTPKDIPGLDPACVKTLLQGDPDSWSAVTITSGSKRIIILNSSHSKARQSSDLMHELAHILIKHTPGRFDITEDGLLLLSTFNRAQEAEAAWLSGCLLLPRAALLRIHGSGLEHKEIVRRYGVSLDMLQYRLRVTGVDLQVARARQYMSR